MKNLGKYCLAFMLASCASAPWQPVPPASGKIQLRGFSFDLGDAAGWNVNRRSQTETQIMLVKSNHANDPYENYSLEAYVLQAPLFATDDAFMKAVQEGKAIQGNPRYKVLGHESRFQRIQDRNCALSHTTAEDMGGNAIPAFGFGNHRRPGAMVFEEATLSCRQDSDPKNVLDLSFSLRYYPGEGDPEFTDKAMAIFKSVTIR